MSGSLSRLMIMHMELMSATEVSITYTAVKSTKGTEVEFGGHTVVRSFI